MTSSCGDIGEKRVKVPFSSISLLTAFYLGYSSYRWGSLLPKRGVKSMWKSDGEEMKLLLHREI